MSAIPQVQLPPPPAAEDGPVPIEEFIRSNQAGVWRYLRLLGAEPAVADDLTQEAFLVAMRRGAFRRPFVLRTARNLWLRSRRDSSRHEKRLAEIATRLWQDECEADGGDAQLDALRTCVEQLDGRARQCVDRFYRDGVSREALAEEFGLKETGIKTLLQRIRAQLRQCIEGKLAR